MQSLPQCDFHWKTFSKETIVVQIAKQEYHKLQYSHLYFATLPKIDSTMSYLLRFPEKVSTIGLIS